MFKKILSLTLAVLMLVGCAATFASCAGDGDKLGESDPILPEITLDTNGITIPADFKIGIICLHGQKSTYDKNFLDAMDRVKKALNLTDAQVIIATDIPEGPECADKAQEMVDQGCKIVFADSFGHDGYMLATAKNNPTVQFCHATGTQALVNKDTVPNYHNAFASIYEGRYLAGIVAGMKLNELKAAGKLKGDVPMMGYVGAFTYAEVISGYTSFYLGAKSVCSDVQMKVQFTGSWYDETEEKAAAEALIAAGCDLISQHADSMGAPTACEDANIPNVSYNGSTYTNNENTFLVSSRIDWAPYFLYIIKQVCAGQAIDTNWTGSIKTGSVLLSGINQDVVAEGTKEALDAAIAKLNAGTLHVFDINTFTVKGAKLTTYMADVEDEIDATTGKSTYAPDTEAVSDGYFHESEYRSAPYFDIQIDGIELLNSKF